ncbi:hypothetical protein ACJX0J_036822, partial [Zea mays]
MSIENMMNMKTKTNILFITKLARDLSVKYYEEMAIHDECHKLNMAEQHKDDMILRSLWNINPLCQFHYNIFSKTQILWDEVMDKIEYRNAQILGYVAFISGFLEDLNKWKLLGYFHN